MEKTKRQKSNTNLTKAAKKQAKNDLALLPSTLTGTNNIASTQFRQTIRCGQREYENIKSRSPQYRKLTNKNIQNLKPKKSSGTSKEPLKDIVNKQSSSSDGIKLKNLSRSKKNGNKSPVQEYSDKPNHNANANGRSADSNESRKSKRNQKIQEKQDKQGQKVRAYAQEPVSQTTQNRARPGPKREQMTYLEKKDLATDASLKYYQHQQSIGSMPGGQDYMAALHGASISSFLGMSEEKSKKIRKIEDDQIKRVEILEMDGDKIIENGEINTNSQLYQSSKNGQRLGNPQHMSYCFYDSNQNNSNAHIDQFPQNKTFVDSKPMRNLQESTVNHESQDELDLLICSEKPSEINLIFSQNKMNEATVEQTLSLKSPCPRENDKQNGRNDPLRFGVDDKIVPRLDTSSPLNLHKQEDSANLCTAFGAEDYTANKMDHPRQVGDFQEMINDHTELFFGKPGYNPIDSNDQDTIIKPVNNRNRDKQIQLDDLDQSLEINVKKPNDNKRRQIITNVNGNQNRSQVQVGNSGKFRLTSRSSNRSQEFNGIVQLHNANKTKKSYNFQTQNDCFSPDGAGLGVPNFEKLNNAKSAQVLHGRRNSAANQPYRSLSLNTINFKYSSNGQREPLLGHKTHRSSVNNGENLKNYYMTNNSCQQNLHYQTNISYNSSQNIIQQRPMQQIGGATIKKSPIFQNQKDIQMALIHSLVLDQKSPVGRPLQMTKVQDIKCNMAEQNEQNNSQNKYLKSKMSSTMSNQSFKLDQNCQQYQSVPFHVGNPTQQANGPLKEKFQDMTLEAGKIKVQGLDITQRHPDSLSEYQAPSSYSCSSNMKSNNTRRSQARSNRTIEKLKSPRGNPLPPINKSNMMDFLNDALDGQVDTDDDQPFDPKQNLSQNLKINRPDVNELEIAQDIAEMLAVDRQDKSSQKGAELQPIQTGSERLTDLGDSPEISPQDRMNVFKGPTLNNVQGDEKDLQLLRLNSKQNYYDPHEPHSAQTRGPELAESRGLKRQSSMKNGLNQSPELVNFKDDQSPSNSPQGAQFDRMNKLNQFLGENDEFLDDEDDDQGLMQLKNVQEQEPVNTQNNMEQNMDNMLLYDNDLQLLYDHQQPPAYGNNDNQFKQGEQSEEAQLIDDGFFDNLVNKQSNKNGYNVIKEEQKQILDAEPNLIQSVEMDSQDTRLYGTYDFTQANMGYEVSLRNQSNHYIPRVSDQQQLYHVSTPNYYHQDINTLIKENVKNSYFPQATQNLEFFEQMLVKEQKIQQFNHLNPQINWQGLFQRQTELSAEMRVILLDWLCQVSSDYCLKRQTFHLALQFVDAYFERCQNHIPKSEFQLIGITCLHMAAKIEEIYPPHINSFAESTNDSVTTQQIIGQEFKVCNQLNWNFEQFITTYTWATWFMKRWDEYVDESLSYLKQQFQLKFFEGTRESNQKFLTFMQFVDILSLSYESKQFTQRMIVACIMYLILGGKNIMCAFQIEYRDMLQAFSEQFPIIDPSSFNQTGGEFKPNRIPEGILFYNQIIQPFFVKEFGLYLHEMIQPLKFVLKFFILDVDEGSSPPYGLIQQCRCTLKQHREIALEKAYAVKEEMALYGSMGNYECILSFKNNPNITEFTDEDVFLNVNEFFSYQTYNSQTLDTLKFIQNLEPQPTQAVLTAGPTAEPKNRCTIDGLDSDCGVRVGSRPDSFAVVQLNQDDNEQLRNQQDHASYNKVTMQVSTSEKCEEELIDNSLLALEQLDNLNFGPGHDDDSLKANSQPANTESYSDYIRAEQEQSVSAGLVNPYQD